MTNEQRAAEKYPMPETNSNEPDMVDEYLQALNICYAKRAAYMEACKDKDEEAVAFAEWLSIRIDLGLISLYDNIYTYMNKNYDCKTLFNFWSESLNQPTGANK